MTEPVCVISGVGPGTGSALVRRFSKGGYRIAMLARNAERLADLAGQVPSAKAYVCDVSDQSQVDATMGAVEREMGAPSVLLHNAVGGAWGTFTEIDPAVQIRLRSVVGRILRASRRPRRHSASSPKRWREILARGVCMSPTS